MKIGIVLYSQTGNALSVAEKIQAKMEANGHDVSIERLPGADKPPAVIDITQYEGLIFASAVQAFRLALPMVTFLSGMPAISGKPCACYVTKSLNNDWTGGNKAISEMRKAIEGRGGNLLGHGILRWNSKKREEEITALVEQFAQLF